MTEPDASPDAARAQTGPAGGPAVDVPAGTLAVYADLGCAFAHLCVHRLHEARRLAGLEDHVHFELRALPLEELQPGPLPMAATERTMAALAPLAPAAGWQVWSRRPAEWPVTTLLALEAVQAARAQGHAAHEQLDRALRVALFRDSACISVRSEILEVAARCPAVDAHRLQQDLTTGTARAAVYAQLDAARPWVHGSPHVVLPDGTDVFNPGLEIDWVGGPERGFLAVRRDDPTVFDDLVRRAAA